MGNTPTKEASFRNAAASGDVQFVRQCMRTDDRERLLSATTGFLSGRKTVLHLAAKHGNAEVIASVLGPLVDAVTAEIVDGVYPGKAAELLGKVANQQDGRGRTPLLTACFCGHWDCAELLLEAGANAFAADKDGNGALHLAAINGHAQLVQQLLEKAEAQAITGRLAAAVNLSGFTALHYAAWSHSVEVVRLLLAAGVDQMQCNWDEYDRWLIVPTGSTPLHVAALHHLSGACLVMLQSFALQLREWLPGDPAPVDPRARRDNKGELPVEVAIRTGLLPSSQLALCLQPSVDILSVFGAQQLDDMRRCGPPPLRLIAAEALRTDLLHKLGDLQGQQQLLLHQRQIEKQLRQRQRQQQQRQDEEQAVHGSSWQRWWSRNSIDQQRAATAAAAAGIAGSEQHRHTSDSRHSKLWGAPADWVGSSSRMFEVSRSDHALPEQDDNSNDSHHAELVYRLHRTPSITLGAVQYAKTSPDNSMTAMAGHVQHGELQHPSRSSNSSSNVGGEQLSAPAGEDVTLDTAAAAKLANDHVINASPAAPAVNVAADACSNSSAASVEVLGVDTRSCRLLATASITLGYLDRVWTLDKMQQQQQQQQQQHEGSVAAAASSVAAPSTPGLTVLQGSNLNSSSSSSTSGSKIGDSSLGEIEAIEHDMDPQEQQQQQQQQPGPATATADASVSVHMSSKRRVSRGGSPSLRGGAAPPTAATTADTTFQHINDHIHRATGSTGAFALINGPYQPRSEQQQDGITTSTSSSNNSNSNTGSSVAGDKSSVALRFRQDSFQQQQQRCLQTSSITLAELVDSNSRGGVPGSADEAKLNNNSSSSNHGQGSRMMRRGANGPRTPQQLLERAGIKGKSWEQFMTPRSWLLYQQQRDDGILRLQQQQQQQGSTPQGHVSASSTAGSTPGSTAAAGQVGKGLAAGSSNNSGASSFAARRAVLLSNRHRSPHRRSFELPGASAGMSAMFGANRQHVSRMLREAGAVDPKTLYKTLTRTQGSLAVATSLAGALPGCVSEKLVQVVDVSRSINPGPLLAGPGSNPASDAAVFGGSNAAAKAADGVSVGSSHSEVCAICADKVPAVGLAGCGHMLCFECTKCIVGEGIGSRPPLCPFCRRHITGFGLVAAATGGL